jgi:hypothetical protein
MLMMIGKGSIKSIWKDLGEEEAIIIGDSDFFLKS